MYEAVNDERIWLELKAKKESDGPLNRRWPEGSGREKEMKKGFKQAIAAALSFIIVWGSLLPVSAQEYSQMFEQVMNRIEQDYTGNVSRQELFEAAMKGMFERLDEYSEFFDYEQTRRFEKSINKNFEGIGIQFRRENKDFVVVKLILGGSAGEGGILVGDILLGADGVSFEGMTTTDEVAAKILGEKGTYVTVEVKRGQQKLSFRLERRSLHLPTVEQPAWKELPIDWPAGLELKSLLYIAISSFGEETAAEFKSILELPENKAAKLLILDLRDNGGGYVHSVIEIARMLIPKGKIVSFRDNQQQEEVYYSELEQIPYANIIVLVNKNSASAAEILAAALKDSGIGILVGERTFGKGVAQEILSLAGGEYSFKLTFKDFFTPNGDPVHKLGVAPHVLVETPNYIISDRRFFIGDENETIDRAEKILKYLGYFEYTPDNKYGEETLPAVLAFQKENGLGQYPVLDFTTQSALNTALRRELSRKDRVLEAALAEAAKKLK